MKGGKPDKGVSWRQMAVHKKGGIMSDFKGQLAKSNDGMYTSSTAWAQDANYGPSMRHIECAKKSTHADSATPVGEDTAQPNKKNRSLKPVWQIQEQCSTNMYVL